MVGTSGGRKYARNVAWLLGPQILASLARIVAWSSDRKRFDQRDWMSPDVEARFKDAPGDFHWDYIADTGDGGAAMYSLARLLYSDLWVAADGTVSREPIAGATALPRGAFLFVGGDTAYPIADYPTLANHFTQPFADAHADLGVTVERPIFGIPGNHDYYDEVNGFAAVFAKPPTLRVEHDRTDIGLPGFVRSQMGTYVAIQLPHGWWFWGIDLESGTLDARQRTYFHTACAKPAKLVLATPEPALVNGARGGVCATIETACADLGIEPPNAPDCWPAGGGKARVELSGDTHNYQRYYGTGAAPYASIVSGGGGAFMHPTSIDFGRAVAEAKYPSPEKSHKAVGAKALNPLNVLRDGFGVFIGAALAMILYHSAACVGSGRAFWAIPFGWLGFTIERSDHAVTPYLRCVGVTLAYLAGLAIIYKSRTYAMGHRSMSSRELPRTRRYGLSAIGITLGLVLPWVAIAYAGRQPAENVLAHVLSALVILGTIVGLAMFAVKVGAEQHHFRGRVGFGIVGALFGVWELFVPLVITLRWSWTVAGAEAIAIAVLYVIGRAAMLLRPHGRWRGAMLAWAIGAVVVTIAVPLLVGERIPMDTPTRGWDEVQHVAVAGLVGLLWTSVALAWYFAFCYSQNAHSNETAIVARVDSYKQFIRFRVAADGTLTGYVIGFDHPMGDARPHVPHLVDTFTVR
ncbi:MAG TPA: hypothetical protein VGM88_25015 [Kofleriaceae bacterium]